MADSFVGAMVDYLHQSFSFRLRWSALIRLLSSDSFGSIEILSPFIKSFCFDNLNPVKEKKNEVMSRDFTFSL